MDEHTKTDSQKSISGKGITNNVGIFESDSRLSSFKKGVPAIVLVSVLVIAMGVYVFSQILTNKNLCSDELMQEVRSSINGSRPAQLHDIANNVKTMDGYEENINCMFIIAKDDLRQGQVTEGVKSYNKIAELYENGNRFSSSLGSDKDVKAEFERDRTFLKLLQKESTINNSGIIEP